VFLRGLNQHLWILCIIGVGIAHSAVAAPILDIQTNGLKKVEREAVLQKISEKVNSEFDESKVRADIQILYDMGYFDGIEVSQQPVQGGIRLIFDFVERPVIADVEIEGNDNISTSDLEEVIKVKKWTIVDINKIQEDVGLIQKTYEEKGYYLAHASYELKPNANGEVKLVYHIADYEKVQIKKIVFLNNHKFTDDRLKSVFQETREGEPLSVLSSSGTFKESSFKNDLQRLVLFYLDNGYVKFKQENPIITISEDKRFVTISIYVDEGEQYQMGKIDFSGDLLFPRGDLEKEVQMTEGKTFSITQRNADIQRLTEKYQDLGYAFVNVIPKMDIDDATKTVAMNYGFEKGSLVHFGEIRVVGNTKTFDKVIRRELRINEGELFSGSKLRISKERVERLGFFAPGEVTFNQVTHKDRDDIVDIEINIKERSTGSVTLGAGYSSVQSFFFTGQIQEINLFGRGQSLSFQAQYGAENIWRSYSLSFMEPHAWDSDWSAGSDIYISNSPIPYRYLIRRSGVQLKTGYPMTDDITAYFTYKLEYLTILESLLNPGAYADPTLDKGFLSSVVLSAVRDVRNNRFETTGGNYQSLSFELAGLGGQKDFAKIIANNRVFWNFFENFVFRNEVEIGGIMNTWGPGIPPAEKFFLGGPFNLRGFEAFSVSPVNNTQYGPEQAGGSSEAFALFEIEHPLIKEAGLKWVIFYDIGNSFPGMPFLSGNQPILRSDWGVGVRWFSPLGPLRFEWGFPITRVYNAAAGIIDPSSQFIFFIGTPF